MILDIPFIPGVPEQLIRSINDRLRSIPDASAQAAAPVSPTPAASTGDDSVTIDGMPVLY